MKIKLYLSGGGNENETYLGDKNVFREIKKILYIPIAYDKDETYQECEIWFKNMLSRHGNFEYDILKNPHEKTILGNYDIIYIGGGNTFKLLKELKESGLGEQIREYVLSGRKVYGGSAGAIIWGYSIDLCSIGSYADENIVNLKDTKGFNLFSEIDIQCHYNEKEFQLDKQYSEKNKRNILALPEGCVIEYDGEKYSVLGDKKPIFITVDIDNKI